MHFDAIIEIYFEDLLALKGARIVDASPAFAVAKCALIDVNTDRISILHSLFGTVPTFAVIAAIN